MDALKAEIAVKRKNLEADIGPRQTKYMRRGDIERIKQEQEQAAKQERAQNTQEEAAKVIATEQAKPDAYVSILPVLRQYIIYMSMESRSHPGRLPSRLFLNPEIQAHQSPNHLSISLMRRPSADSVPKDSLSDCLPKPIETGGYVYVHWS